MTLKQAEYEARRRWPNARDLRLTECTSSADALYPVRHGEECAIRCEWPDESELYGIGPTWEQAFANADHRERLGYIDRDWK